MKAIWKRITPMRVVLVLGGLLLLSSLALTYFYADKFAAANKNAPDDPIIPAPRHPLSGR